MEAIQSLLTTGRKGVGPTPWNVQGDQQRGWDPDDDEYDFL
jgi:hypothetical protein